MGEQRYDSNTGWSKKKKKKKCERSPKRNNGGKSERKGSKQCIDKSKEQTLTACARMCFALIRMIESAS